MKQGLVSTEMSLEGRIEMTWRIDAAGCLTLKKIFENERFPQIMRKLRQRNSDFFVTEFRWTPSKRHPATPEIQRVTWIATIMPFIFVHNFIVLQVHLFFMHDELKEYEIYCYNQQFEWMNLDGILSFQLTTMLFTACEVGHAAIRNR